MRLPNSIDIDLNAEVKVTFNQNVTAETLTGITFTPSVTGVSASIDGADLIIAHDDFESGTEYTVNIPAGTIDGYDSVISWMFRTKFIEREVSDPYGLAVNVIGLAANLTWKHGVGDETYTFNIYLDGVKVDSGVTDLQYAFTNLEPGRYKAGVEAVGEAGLSNIIPINFTVVGPVEIVSKTPEEGTTGVARFAEVKVTFNQNITAGTLSDVTFTPSIRGVSARVMGTDLIIAHNQFASNTVYTVNIPAGVVAGYDEEISWSFTVGTVEIDTNSIEVLDGAGAISIYPNPVSDILYIKSTEIVKQIEVLSVDGKLLKTVMGAVNELPVRDLRSGVYILRITTNKGVAIKRIIKN